MVEDEASFSHMMLTLSYITDRAYPHAFAVPEHKVCNRSDCMVCDTPDMSLDGRQLQLYGVSFNVMQSLLSLITKTDVCDV
jgi:hypothetical protein